MRWYTDPVLCLIALALAGLLAWLMAQPPRPMPLPDSVAKTLAAPTEQRIIK